MNGVMTSTGPNAPSDWHLLGAAELAAPFILAGGNLHSPNETAPGFPQAPPISGSRCSDYCFGAVVAGPVVPVVERLALLSPSSSKAGAA
jgi:hypothetical protein